MSKEFSEFPKQLYRSGWEDLNDSVVVNDEEGEEAARADGFKMLAEDESAGDDAAPKRTRKAKAAE